MTLARKCESSYWLTCGADGLTDVRSRYYQNFLDGSITKFSIAMRGSAGARFDRSCRSFAIKQKCETLLVFSVMSFKVKINIGQ